MKKIFMIRFEMMDPVSGVITFCYPKKATTVQAIIKQELSLADELTKLKKLHDDRILNNEEYETAKKKLLEKN